MDSQKHGGISRLIHEDAHQQGHELILGLIENLNETTQGGVPVPPVSAKQPGAHLNSPIIR